MKKILSAYFVFILSASIIVTPITQSGVTKAAEIGTDTEETVSILEETAESNEQEKVDMDETIDLEEIETVESTDVTEETQADIELQQENNLVVDSSDEIQETIENVEEMITAQESAEEEALDLVSGKTLTASGTCGQNVHWELYEDTLNIYGKGNMTDYNSYNYYPGWYEYRNNIKSIIISSGVTSIGDSAFCDCNNVSEISISEGVKRIGDLAFYGCSNLSKIILPEGVTSIGDSAFCNCNNVSEINLPEGVMSIGDGAFVNCHSLSKINLPKGVKRIGDFTFQNCISLSEIILPEGVTSIGNRAFSGCVSLSKISLPKEVTSIGDYAFYVCDSLSEIILPEGVTGIGYCAFWKCISLSEIILPEGVMSIENGAFYGCISLSKISILNENCNICNTKEAISDTATIYGYINSTAETYAKNYNRSFQVLDDTYTIIYDANGGKNAPSEQMKQRNKTLTLNKEKPTRTGYTFLGWSTSKNSTKATYIAGASFNENKNTTLYAVWKANSYKIVFDKNGGVGSMSTISCTYDKNYTLAANTFKRTGYTFKGWNTKADGTGMYSYGDKATVKNVSSVNGKTMKFYAQWTVNQYKIAFDKNGGTGSMSTISCTYDKNYTLAVNTFKRTGYTFRGWNTKADGTGKYSYGDKATVKNVSSVNGKTMKLYAQWTANQYKIAFDKNGGTGSMSTISCTYGKNYTLAVNAFKRTGYTFKGWNTKADGTGKYSYSDKATVKNVSSVNGKTIKLYAQWVEKKYNITYRLNGGTNNKANPTSYKTTTATITLKNPTRKGYTFGGWYTSSNYKTKVTKIVKGSTGNKTLYAKWTRS